MHDLDRLEPVYLPHRANLDKDLFLPIAKYSTKFDCMSGYFTGGFLKEIAHSLSCYLSSSTDRKMRFIIGPQLSSDSDIEAFESAIKQKKNLFPSLFPGLELTVSNLQNNTTKMLCYLIASNRLELKIAYMAASDAIFHPKTYLFDTPKGSLAVAGGANATKSGMTSNGDQLTLSRAWRNEDAKQICRILQAEFDLLWSGKDDKILCEALNESTMEHIKKINSSASDIEKNDIEEYIKNIIKDIKESQNLPELSIPTIPPFRYDKPDPWLHDYQIKAIDAWWSDDLNGEKSDDHRGKGILELATGTGKTITSIYAACLVYKEQIKNNNKLALIIAVPYKNLAKQWVEELKEFNIYPIKCWSDYSGWEKKLEIEINNFVLNTIKFTAIVVVNDSIATDRFSQLVRKFEKKDTMFIGDECHHHGAKKINSALPESKYRMGLSATPFKSENDEYGISFPDKGRDRIKNYYSQICYTVSLEDAIYKYDVLCPYNYHIVACRLTASEQDNYDKYSDLISKLWAQKIASGLSQNQESQLTMLNGKRSKLIGGAVNKITALKKLLDKIKDRPKKHTLFYCGEGNVHRDDEKESSDLKIVEQVTEVLNEKGWVSSRFTSKEKGHKLRESIMSTFKDESIDALVTMKVLDEGIDIPACRQAFILASTKNERQYIQRRGRVLRKDDSKTEAEIYDFVVLPAENHNSKASEKLKDSERQRVYDFCGLATNKVDILSDIEKWELNYD